MLLGFSFFTIVHEKWQKSDKDFAKTSMIKPKQFLRLKILALRNFPVHNNPERNIPERNIPERNNPVRNNPKTLNVIIPKL